VLCYPIEREKFFLPITNGLLLIHFVTSPLSAAFAIGSCLKNMDSLSLNEEKM
jgi:hypothetical protein